MILRKERSFFPPQNRRNHDHQRRREKIIWTSHFGRFNGDSFSNQRQSKTQNKKGFNRVITWIKGRSKLKLHTCRVKFPLKYRQKSDSMVSHWKESNMRILRHAQDNWNQNQHISVFRSKHSTRSMALDLGTVFNASRMLRVCSNIPYLIVVGATVPSEVMRWRNESVTTMCSNSSNGRLREDCSLITFYSNFIRACSKLRVIEAIISDKKYKIFAALIMSFFSEMTLIVDRVSQFYISTWTCTRAEIVAIRLIYIDICYGFYSQ